MATGPSHRSAGGYSRLTPEVDKSLTGFILTITAISLACLLGRVALGMFSGGTMNRVSLEFVRALTDSLHRKLQRLPLAYFDRQETGELMARLTNDVGTLLIFLSANSLQLIADLVLAGGILVGLLLISWPLALASFVALPLFFGITADLPAASRLAHGVQTNGRLVRPAQRAAVGHSRCPVVRHRKSRAGRFQRATASANRA